MNAASMLAIARNFVVVDTTISLRTVRWTRPQEEFRRWVDPLASAKDFGRPLLLRAGNQWLGKSYVGVSDTIERCLGTHPNDNRAMHGGIIAIVVSPSDGHSVQIQGKCWELAPKDSVDPASSYDAAKGFRGRRPTLKFRNGSIIHFRTAGQGALNLSGITADHVQIDELCPESVYDELRKRVARRRGTVRLTLTPVNAPGEWLRNRVDIGEIAEIHYRCEARYCLPVGSAEPIRDAKTGEMMDALWIERFIAETPIEQREVRCHGEWMVEHANRELAGWTDDFVFVTTDKTPMMWGKPSTTPQWRAMPRFQEYGIGIDYGESANRTVVEFVANSPSDGVFVLDEWCGDGKTPIDEIARAIVRMILRHGLQPSHVRRWVGDINSAGGMGQIGSMNDALSSAIFMVCQSQRLVAPTRLVSPAKGRGSVDHRIRLINEGLSRRNIRVHERCNRLTTSFRTYVKGHRNSLILKDPLDAFGYVAEPWLLQYIPQPSPDVRFIVR